jgi:hypothetical protein
MERTVLNSIAINLNFEAGTGLWKSINYDAVVPDDDHLKTDHNFHNLPIHHDHTASFTPHLQLRNQKSSHKITKQSSNIDIEFCLLLYLPR